MKNFRIIYLAIISFFYSSCFAADLYVRDMGAGGSYPTISAAITAATDGDRIIVKPKAGGIPYLENLTINKSLTFVCENNYAKYLVQGSITITPAVGRTINISNINLTGGVTSSNSPAGGRTTLNVMNSVFGGAVNMYVTNTTLNISGCTLSDQLNFVHGKVTGNNISSSSILLLNDTGTDLASSPVLIAGNKCYNIQIATANYEFKIFNNYVVASSTTTPIMVSSAKAGSTNFIENNTVIQTSSQNAIAITGTTAAGNSVVSIVNNIINVNGGGGYKVTDNNPYISTYVYYNMSSGSFLQNGLTSSSSNIGNASITIDSATGNTTGANVNAGYPAEEYQDLDLTLNDIGNTGGSNAWSNYWPTNATNKPQIYFLETPRRVYTGTINIQIEAGGYSK